jgi:hypothetical protein
MTVRADRARIVAEFLGGGMLEDHPTAVDNRAGERGEVFARMKTCLVAEPNARPAGKRHVLREHRVESQLACQGRLLLERGGQMPGRLPDRGVQIPGHPGKTAVDVQVVDDRVNLCDGRQSCVPHGLRMIAAKVVHEAREAHIGDHRQMRGGVAGVDLGQPFAFEQRDTGAFERQEIRGSQPGDTAADDHDVDLLIALELGETGQLR